MNGGSNLRINSHKQPFSRTDNLLPNSTGLLICKSSGKLFEEAKIHSRQQKSTQRNEEREREVNLHLIPTSFLRCLEKEENSNSNTSQSLDFSRLSLEMIISLHKISSSSSLYRLKVLTRQTGSTKVYSEIVFKEIANTTTTFSATSGQNLSLLSKNYNYLTRRNRNRASAVSLPPGFISI